MVYHLFFLTLVDWSAKLTLKRHFSLADYAENLTCAATHAEQFCSCPLFKKKCHFFDLWGLSPFFKIGFFFLFSQYLFECDSREKVTSLSS